MKNLRTHGEAPFSVAVVHGGPGAPGEMAPVARELAAHRGVLEPLQTAASLEGQVQELMTTLEERGDLPMSLIGFSWGAWLSFILTARHPQLVRKLILVGSGPFEDRYAAGIRQTRLTRLSDEERSEISTLSEALGNPEAAGRNAALARFGALCAKADAYDPLRQENSAIEVQVDIFRRVWPEAAELRRNGRLLDLANDIRCPVVVIHGDYDPHPAEGVHKPLSAVLESFRFILLRNCGHKPWIERQARDRFYRILKEELL